MRTADECQRVFDLASQGLDSIEISRKLDIPSRTIREWLRFGEEQVFSSLRRKAAFKCPGSLECANIVDCPIVNSLESHFKEYTYLLGQYLGDGCISQCQRTYKLRISTADNYPHIKQDCINSLNEILPDNKVGLIPKEGCTDISCHSNHLPCLFPHGKGGMKHKRKIVLLPWQEKLAIETHPQQFLRGLIHSDGCRTNNQIIKNGKEYNYPRYFFSNRSQDIHTYFELACQTLEIDYKFNNWYSISIAKRNSVEKVDTFVGSKM